MDNNYYHEVWQKIIALLDNNDLKKEGEESFIIPPPENNPDFTNCLLKQFNIDAR